MDKRVQLIDEILLFSSCCTYDYYRKPWCFMTCCTLLPWGNKAKSLVLVSNLMIDILLYYQGPPKLPPEKVSLRDNTVIYCKTKINVETLMNMRVTLRTNTDYKMLFTKNIRGTVLHSDPEVPKPSNERSATFSLQDVNMDHIFHNPLCALFVSTACFLCILTMYKPSLLEKLELDFH